MAATLIGLAVHVLLGPGYLAGGVSMLLTITLMILLDAVHPPAVSTALAFAFRAGQNSTLLVFALAVGVTVTLLGIERVTVWRLAVLKRRKT